jgi:hypothetical protein
MLNKLVNISRYVATLALGSQPRQGLAKLRAKRKPGITSHIPRNARKCERVNPHTPKATPTWEVKVSKDFRIFREQLEGLKPIGLKSSLYH